MNKHFRKILDDDNRFKYLDTYEIVDNIPPSFKGVSETAEEFRLFFEKMPYGIIKIKFGDAVECRR